MSRYKSGRMWRAFVGRFRAARLPPRHRTHSEASGASAPLGFRLATGLTARHWALPRRSASASPQDRPAAAVPTATRGVFGFRLTTTTRPGAALEAKKHAEACFFVGYAGGGIYIMPPMPPAGIAGAGVSSFLSAMTHSVVRNMPAMEAAFSRATRVTLAGSMTPAARRFS